MYLQWPNGGVIYSQFQISKSLKPFGAGEPFLWDDTDPWGESFLGRATQRPESDS